MLGALVERRSCVLWTRGRNITLVQFDFNDRCGESGGCRARELGQIVGWSRWRRFSGHKDIFQIGGDLQALLRASTVSAPNNLEIVFYVFLIQPASDVADVVAQHKDVVYDF